MQLFSTHLKTRLQNSRQLNKPKKRKYTTRRSVGGAAHQASTQQPTQQPAQQPRRAAAHLRLSHKCGGRLVGDLADAQNAEPENSGAEYLKTR